MELVRVWSWGTTNGCSSRFQRVERASQDAQSIDLVLEQGVSWLDCHDTLEQTDTHHCPVRLAATLVEAPDFEQPFLPLDARLRCVEFPNPVALADGQAQRDTRATHVPPTVSQREFDLQSGQSNVHRRTGSCAKKQQTCNITKNASASSMTRNVSLHRYRLLKGKPPFLGPILLITDGPLVHRACRPRLALTFTSCLSSSLSVKLVHSYHLTAVDCFVSTKRGSAWGLAPLLSPVTQMSDQPESR